MTFRPTTSGETADRFRAKYERRVERIASGRPWPYLRWTTAQANCLREILVEQVGYFPRRPVDIFEATRNEYGSCEPKRLEYALKSAVDQGLIERVEGGYRRVRARRSA